MKRALAVLFTFPVVLALVVLTPAGLVLSGVVSVSTADAQPIDVFPGAKQTQTIGLIKHPTQTCIDVAGGTDELCVTDGEVTVTALQEQTTSGIPIQRTDGTQVGFVGENAGGGLEVQSSTSTLTLGRSGQTTMLVCNGSACTLGKFLSIQDATNNLQVGAGGATIDAINCATATIDFPSVGADLAGNVHSNAQNAAVSGWTAGYPCFVAGSSNPLLNFNGTLECEATSSTNVVVRITNANNAANDLPSQTFRFCQVVF